MSRSRPLALYGAALVLLVLSGGMLTRYFGRLESDMHWVEHSHETTLSLERGLSRLTEAESCVRGFVITGDDGFLSNYEDSIRQARVEYKRSDTLTRDNASQHTRILHLQDVAEKRILRMEAGIAKRRIGPVVGPPPYVGSALMSELRVLVAAAIKEEEGLLEMRMADRRSAFRKTYFAAMVALILSFILLAIAGPVWAWNIARRRQLEVEAKQARERESASAFREVFIGILGHDLRSPISSIAVGAELLHRRKLPEESAKVVARIRLSIDRMERMVDQILDFARSRLGGGIPIEPKPTALGDLVKKIIDEFRDVYPTASIQFDPENAIMGDWDPDRLLQVMSNLIGNAIVHGDSSGVVEVRIQSDGNVANLTVHNEGPPIPSEIQSSVFEPFRSGRRKSAKSKGLGLGLFVCDQIVRAHGGSIQVKSGVDEGTTFEVQLPIAQQRAVNSAATRSQ